MVQIGYDYLGAQSDLFNAAAAARHVPENSILGTLHNTFGASLSNIRTLLNSGNFSNHRVHLINGPGIRNQNCGRYEIGYGYTVREFEAAVLKRDRKIIKYVQDSTLLYSDLMIGREADTWVSPILEHNLTPRAWQVLADVVRDVWPRVQLVNNAMDFGNLTAYKGAFREYHGIDIKRGTEINSFDGIEATDSDMDKWLKAIKNLVAALVWTRLYNFRHQGKFEDPRRRTLEVDRYQYEMLNHIATLSPAKPTNVPFKVTSAFKAPMVWKPLAEDKDGTDPKSNAPVAILPLTNADISVIGIQGKQVAKLGHYGTFSGTPGHRRYYSKHGEGSDLQGYQIQKRAEKQGSPWAWIKQGNQIIGPFLPGRRQGDYRD